MLRKNPGLKRRSFLGFAVISGCGWLIDIGLTMGLVAFGVPPFWASLVGAGTAVTFVYIVSLHAIFGVDGALGARGFPIYIIWQVFAISVASVLVASLAHLLVSLLNLEPWAIVAPLSLASGAAKALVTPLTLLANFFFIRWLTLHLRQGSVPSADEVIKH